MIEGSQKHGASLVAATGQSWKMAVGITATMIGLLAGGVQFLGPRGLSGSAFFAVLACGAVSFSAFFAIRCPRCRRSLGWYAFKRARLTTFEEDLDAIAACPHCGYAGRDRARSPR